MSFIGDGDYEGSSMSRAPLESKTLSIKHNGNPHEKLKLVSLIHPKDNRPRTKLVILFCGIFFIIGFFIWILSLRYIPMDWQPLANFIIGMSGFAGMIYALLTPAPKGNYEEERWVSIIMGPALFLYAVFQLFPQYI